MNNSQILENALNTGKLVSFIRGGQKESNVKIIALNSDDICNKDFIFETKSGQRFNGFENNIIIL